MPDNTGLGGILISHQNGYAKTRNYWKYLKAKLKKKGSQVVSATTQLKTIVPKSNAPKDIG